MSKIKNQIIGIDIEDLLDMIRVTVRNEMDACITDGRFGSEFKDETWDRKRVAEFLKISPEKVTELYNKKEISGKKLGREYFFLKSQIIELFKKRKS